MSQHKGKPSAAELVRRLRKNGDCLEWTGGCDGKYGVVHVGFNRYVRAHRYAYELLVGKSARGMQLLHSCDNKLCCNPEHLREGTNAENMREKADRASIKSRKLDKQTLGQLRALRRDGFSLRAIGRNLGVSASAVAKVLRGKTYYGAQYE